GSDPGDIRRPICGTRDGSRPQSHSGSRLKRRNNRVSSPFPLFARHTSGTGYRKPAVTPVPETLPPTGLFSELNLSKLSLDRAFIVLFRGFLTTATARGGAAALAVHRRAQALHG